MTQSDFLILTKKIAPAVIDFVPVLLSGGWEFPLESSGSRLEGFHVWDYFFFKEDCSSEFATFITSTVWGVKKKKLTYILQLLFSYLKIWCQIGKVFLLHVL